MALSGDDKLIAAYVHIPVIGGTLIPIIVWLIYKDKKEKEILVFQAKQAAVYQIISFILIFVSLITFIGPFILAPIFGIYALYGAWKNFKGEDFEYAIIGKMLREKKLKN